MYHEHVYLLGLFHVKTSHHFKLKVVIIEYNVDMYIYLQVIYYLTNSFF